jgi:GH25 family lysozyme M1 (1,4-beta-N-acetylmuramidase)
MLDQIQTKVLPADDSARNALHEDAMKTSNKNPDSHSNDANIGSKGMSANDQRRAQETDFFKNLYEKANFELDPMTKGESPLQSLEQMVKEGKITLTDDKASLNGKNSLDDGKAAKGDTIFLSHEQLLEEAKRIQDRDFHTMGRNYYIPGDHVKRWTEDEINSKVKHDVDLPKGIDISNWQHSIDWKQVKDAGYQFAFMKATEGVDFVDPTFAEYRKGAQDAGLKVGYYHYFHPQDPVDEQVKLFTDVVGKAEPDSLRLVIDVEDPSQWARYSQEQRVAMVDDFLDGVKAKTGVTPEVSIYCSGNFVNESLGNSPTLKPYSLWIASWGVPEPSVPAPWSNWDFWQYTDAGRVPGIDGRVDLDMYNGADLNQDRSKKA